MGRLLLLGAGHAHMTIMAHLNDYVSQGHEVVAVGPNERHYYSGMGPGLLGGTYSVEDISFPVKQMIENRGGRFIQDKAVRVDYGNRLVYLQSGETVEYDVVSCNTGSHVPNSVLEADAEDVFPVKPIENLLKGRERILELTRERQISIGVVGGGPAALEVASNAWHAAREGGCKGAVVQVYGGGKMLRNVPESARRASLRALKDRSIVVMEGAYVDHVSTGTVRLKNGEEFRHDVIFLALGVKPSPLFSASNLPVGPDGGLLVNEYLHSPVAPEVFGGGDCIHFKPQPLDKVGVYAVRQNPILLHNTLARLNGTPLREFDPRGGYLLVFNTGGGTGVLHKSGIVFGGKPAFWIKDYIDRKFMKEFQPGE